MILTTVINMLVFILVADFYLYWQHRCLHWFAPTYHAIHHKHKYRTNFHMVDHITNWAIFPIGWLIGFTTTEMLPVIVWGIMFTFLAHYQYKPNKKRIIFMTARSHEGHHDHYNKNYGVLLTFWDRAMGTYI